MKEKPLAVVLMSGGMDSCVSAAIASNDFRLAMLHAQYGQRTQKREREAFRRLADHFNVRRTLVVSLDYLSAIGGSSLTDSAIPVPEADLHRSTIPSTYVPFRNAGLLSAAVSWSELLGAEALFVGAVEEDSSGYPDCRKAFFDAFGEAIRTGTKGGERLKVITPVIGMSKREIVELGFSLNAPFHLTWSCYEKEDVACGRCDSCVLRLRGFREAGFDDPILYEEPAAALTVQ